MFTFAMMIDGLLNIPFSVSISCHRVCTKYGSVAIRHTCTYTPSSKVTYIHVLLTC